MSKRPADAISTAHDDDKAHPAVQHTDVLIVGAGFGGLGAALRPATAIGRPHERAEDTPGRTDRKWRLVRSPRTAWLRWRCATRALRAWSRPCCAKIRSGARLGAR